MRNFPAVLILSLSATGIAVARALASHNIKVYGTDHQFAAGIFSKLINKPSFGYKVKLDEKFLENLIEFSERQNLKPVLFPSDDKFIEFVGNNYQILNNYFIMQKSLHPEINKLFLDKKEFYQLCEKFNVQYPKTMFLSGIESIDDIVDQTRFPLILKPHFIHKWKQQLHGQKVIFIKDIRSFKNIFATWRDNLKYMIIQEVIEGDESDIWIFKGYFDENGKILCHFTGRKLRQYPPIFGSASLAESASNDEIAEISIDFLTKLKFQGLCGTEFKFDRRDNEYKMIEINIRPQLWDDLMRISGKEIIWTAYCDMIDDKTQSISEQIYDVKWIYLTRDILSAIWHIKKGNLLLSECVKSYKNLCTDALLDTSDIKMFFGVPIYTLYQFYQFYVSSKE